MEDTQKSRAELLAELQDLRDRLEVSEETLQAIQRGDIDALVVSTPRGERIFTLQSADRSYRLLVEDMQQGAITLSAEGLILSGNRSFAELLKQPLEKLIGSYFQRFISPQDLPLFHALIQQAERGDRNSTELFLMAQDGSEIPIYLSINHLNLGDSAINCLIITDLTEQKRHEKTLASERLAHLILEQAGEAILVCDHTGQIIQASQVASQLWGGAVLHQPFDQVYPLHWVASSFSPIPQEEAIASTHSNLACQDCFSIAAVLQGEHYQGLEVEFRRRDGQVFNLVLNARPLTDRENHFRGAIVILTDITRRRQAEVALQQSQLQLQRQLAEIEAIYQSAPIGLNFLDTDLRFVRINQRLADMNGLPVETHLGHTVREVLPELADAAEQLLRSILETGEPLLNVEISGETQAQPGVQRTWLESFLPLKDGDRIIGISTVCEEITERKQVEESLKRAKAELESRVAERTQELQAANDRLSQELLQRQQIEHQLRQSEARYRAIVEDQTELITRFLPDSTFLFVNGTYCRYFNVNREDIIGTSYNAVIYPADRDRVARLVRSINAENPMITIENRVIDGQGRVRWTQWVNRIVFDAQGNVSELQAVGRDVTDLKQAEQALRDSQERLQLAIEASGDGIWDWNIATDEVYYSPQYFQMLGYAADELPQTSTTWEGLIHPDDRAWVKERLAAHLRDQSVRYEFDYRLRTKSGEWRWIASYGKVVVWDEQRQPLRMTGTHRDINKRKQAEATLQESDRRWRSLLDNVQLVVVELDIQGHIAYCNPYFLALTDYQAKDILGQPWIERFLPPDQQAETQIILREVLEHNLHTHHQNSIVTQAGNERMIAWVNTVLRDTSGQAIGVISIGEDITERYQVERMKAEFISIVSHELRTPLTSMQAALSLLSEKLIDPASAVGEATIQIATEGTDRLVRLVSDILDLERLESGKIHLEKRPCPVDELVNTALAQMQEMAHQSGIRLLATACPVPVYADGDRILQVLINLLSNAIKFSPPESTVWLTAEVQHPSASADEPQATPALASSLPRLLFTVSDPGRGIPADSLERIFERFHQVDASDSREKGGTGLGLAICRSIIQQHSGEIWAESTLGQGSRFFFTLPLTEEAEISRRLGD